MRGDATGRWALRSIVRAPLAWSREAELGCGAWRLVVLERLGILARWDLPGGRAWTLTPAAARRLGVEIHEHCCNPHWREADKPLDPERRKVLRPGAWRRSLRDPALDQPAPPIALVVGQAVADELEKRAATLDAEGNLIDSDGEPVTIMGEPVKLDVRAIKAAAERALREAGRAS
jgi:hypothetical protein